MKLLRAEMLLLALLGRYSLSIPTGKYDRFPGHEGGDSDDLGKFLRREDDLRTSRAPGRVTISGTGSGPANTPRPSSSTPRVNPNHPQPRGGPSGKRSPTSGRDRATGPTPHVDAQRRKQSGAPSPPPVPASASSTGSTSRHSQELPRPLNQDQMNAVKQFLELPAHDPSNSNDNVTEIVRILTVGHRRYSMKNNARRPGVRHGNNGQGESPQKR